MTRIFKPVPSRGAVWGIVISFLTTLPLFILIFIASQGSVSLSIALAFLALILFVPSLYLSWVAKTFRYVVDNGRLSIRHGFWTHEIPLADITSVEVMKLFKWIRTFGAAWPGFYYGKFSIDLLGAPSISVYATTSTRPFVYIKTTRGDIVVSPEDAESFAAYLEERVRAVKERMNLDTSVSGMAEGTVAIQDNGLRPKAVHTSSNGTRVASGFIVLTLTMLAGMALYLSLAMAHLPPSIPLHFDLAGQPTRYGSHKELWIMYGIFALLTLLFVGLTWAKRHERFMAYALGFTSIGVTLIFSLVLFVAVHMAGS